MFNFKKKNLSKLDILLIVSLLGLIIIGLITLYSASLNLDFVDIKSQIFASILGLLGIVMLIFIDYDLLKRSSLPLYIISLILPIILFFFGSGGEEWGSDNWLVIGPISIQPAELIKLFLIVFLAKLIEDNYEKLNQPLTLLKILVIAGIPIALILKEDFGNGIVVVAIAAAMLFTAGLRLLYIFVAGGAVGASLPLLYSRLEPYQKERILNFLNPSRDIGDTGLQANQGKIAIGSGMLTGRGLFKGVQTQNNFIPEKHTDFIFPVLAEEMGFIAVVLVLSLYSIMLYRILKAAREAKDVFGSMVCVGVFALFFVHIFENIGMTLGVMPITGIPLPFFSLGGTSQLVNLLAIGLVLSVRTERNDLEFSIK